jgi:hypothetical protein
VEQRKCHADDPRAEGAERPVNPGLIDVGHAGGRIGGCTPRHSALNVSVIEIQALSCAIPVRALADAVGYAVAWVRNEPGIYKESGGTVTQRRRSSTHRESTSADSAKRKNAKTTEVERC